MIDRPEQDGGENDGGPAAMDAAVRRALVESHRDLAKFLRRRLSNRDEAEEVLQRFILKALERSHDLRDVRSVRGWLGRVLATTIIDYQRAAATRRRRERDTDPVTLTNMAESIEPDREIDEAICQCLYKLLPTLKPEYAEVVWRADLLGEPRDRLAISLGITLNNVTVRLHRARRALKLRLEQMCRTCVVHGFMDCRCDDSQRLQRLRGNG